MEATGREIVRLTCICLYESDEQNVNVFTKTSDAQHGSLHSMKQVLGHQEYPGYAWKNCLAFPMGRFRTNYSQFLQKAVGKVDKPQQVPVAISLNSTLLSVTGSYRMVYL
ncbi:hypothetical protein [Brevibacillus brevis]|uniref:hypothetical protein n=1 Tax=Brevibacillus brevis TaxID=1393 RepID=UPI0025A5EA5A|nr:hypothetical protein [Brevibacillus brevis]WJQ82704.1 hypothetical protein QN310_06100 [Brevibacillus brevis]